MINILLYNKILCKRQSVSLLVILQQLEAI